jgi:hypothetical protein
MTATLPVFGRLLSFDPNYQPGYPSQCLITDPDDDLAYYYYSCKLSILKKKKKKIIKIKLNFKNSEKNFLIFFLNPVMD